MRCSLVLFVLLPFAAACTHTVVGTKKDSEGSSTSSPGGDTTTPEEGPPNNATDTPASRIEGEYCGSQVSAASKCQNGAGYLKITSAASTVIGSLCQSYGSSCAVLTNGYFDGTALSFDTVSTKGTISWYLTLTADGDLLGDARPEGEASEQVALYRIP